MCREVTYELTRITPTRMGRWGFDRLIGSDISNLRKGPVVVFLLASNGGEFLLIIHHLQ